MISRDYPNAPGHRGISTSVEAADALALDLGRLQRNALNAIRNAGTRGLTSEELAHRLGVGREVIQPRTTELRRKHLVRDSGQRRPNRSGKRAIVWCAEVARG